MKLRNIEATEKARKIMQMKKLEAQNPQTAVGEICIGRKALLIFFPGSQCSKLGSRFMMRRTGAVDVSRRVPFNIFVPSQFVFSTCIFLALCSVHRNRFLTEKVAFLCQRLFFKNWGFCSQKVAAVYEM